jgi:hypothetical protein
MEDRALRTVSERLAAIRIDDLEATPFGVSIRKVTSLLETVLHLPPSVLLTCR